MPDTTHTEGGAYIAGDVNTHGGAFIGRDQIFVISGYTGEQLELVLAHLRQLLAGGRANQSVDNSRQLLRVTAPDAPEIVLSEQAARDLLPLAARQANECSYLTALLVNPRYSRWARQFVPLAGSLTTTQLPLAWSDVPPEFTELAVSGEGAGRQVRRIRLQDITEAMARHDALALLGEPGAGKTTTLYKLALDAAQMRLTTGQGQIPLLLPLADYRGYAAPYAFLQATWQQYLGAGDDVAEHLRRGELLLLCDALNEMPFENDRDYRDKMGAWRRFNSEWPGNRLVFTCRSRDYSEPLGLPQIEIEPLDDDRVRTFLGKYLTPARAAEAWDRLAGDPLLKLVRNPYYLAMLCFIVARTDAWPGNRAQLFDEFVGYLLGREAGRGHVDWPGGEPMRAALAALAEAMQPLGQGTRLPRSELVQFIPPQVAGQNGPVPTPPPTVLRLALSATLLDTELAAGESERVRFYHHQLQEYFAARALLSRFNAGEDLADRWRTPRSVSEMPATGPLGDYEPLPPPPPTGWEEPAILAAGLTPNPDALLAAIRQVNPVLAARCLTESGIDPPAGTMAAVQADLVADLDSPRVHLRARLAAGDVLGRLGDPRFREVEADDQRVLLPPLVRLPAGTLRMGSSRWEVLRLGLRGYPAGDEFPRHPVPVAEFAIGQYPVTNAEYACFMAAQGYRQDQWWRTDAAQAWLRGQTTDSGTVSEIMNIWRGFRADPAWVKQVKQAGGSPQTIAIWERLLQMEETEVQALLNQQYADRPRDQPAFWADERYNGASQPVVGVNWYEACAYCDWLTERLRHAPGASSGPDVRVRLPTEAEWEWAAVLNRRWRYPWGRRWAAERANTWEGHVLRPSPVGVFAHGATPEGIHDLSGNVWEWTVSLYRPYPYRADDGRNAPEAEGPRVVRGGSWDANQGHARCAVRLWFVPDSFSSFIGFRGVVSLSDSEF